MTMAAATRDATRMAGAFDRRLAVAVGVFPARQPAIPNLNTDLYAYHARQLPNLWMCDLGRVLASLC